MFHVFSHISVDAETYANSVRHEIECFNMPNQSFWWAFGPEPAPNGAPSGSSFANGKKAKQIIVGQLFRFLLFGQEKEEREEREEEEKGKEKQKEERQKGEEREKRKKGTVRFGNAHDSKTGCS